jgi:hypothetical protein
MAASDQSGGEIAACVQKIRLWTDNFDTGKFSDSVLVDMISESWSEVLGDMYASADNVPLASFDVTLNSTDRYYTLPANVGEIRRVVHYDSNGIAQWEILPRDFLNPAGCGIRFEGTQRFYIDPGLNSGTETVTVEYIPSGNVLLHKGKTAAGDATDSTILLAKAGVPSDLIYGTVDRRPNGYLGCYLGVLNTETGSLPSSYVRFPIQQRIITDYDVSTGEVTVSPDFDFDLSTMAGGSGGDPVKLVYEIYPIEAPIIWSVLARHVSRNLAGVENKQKRFQLQDRLYLEARRACALRWSQTQTRTGRSFNTILPENMDIRGDF